MFCPKVKFEDIQGSYEIRANYLGESKLIDLDIKIKVVGEAYYENIQKYIEEDIIIDSVLTLDIIYSERMTGELTRYSGDFPFRTTIDGNLDYDLEIRLESTIKDLQSITSKDGLEIIARVNHDIELLKSRKVFGISGIEKGVETLSPHSKPSITVYIVQKDDTLWT